MSMTRSKNNRLLKDFTAYCKQYPEERFWQALRNWSEHSFIMADGFDTFYWTKRHFTPRNR